MAISQTSGTQQGGVPSKAALTLRINGHVDEAINTLLEIMRDKNAQDSVRLSAANKIIDKSIADIKAVELSGTDGGPLQINIIRDYISPGGWNVSASAGSSQGPDTLQSVGLASQSSQDINSDREDKA